MSPWAESATDDWLSEDIRARCVSRCCRAAQLDNALRRIALGGTIQEAAAVLHLAPKTVDFHLQNIYSKAGITSRAAATLFAIQNDLMLL